MKANANIYQLEQLKKKPSKRVLDAINVEGIVCVGFLAGGKPVISDESKFLPDLNFNEYTVMVNKR